MPFCIPYSWKFSRGPIFVDCSLGKFLRFNFQGCSRPKAHRYRQVKKFVGLIFADTPQSAKTAKINTLENFPLYGIYMCTSPHNIQLTYIYV